MNTPYENLAQAIVLSAAKDYRSARFKLKYHPKSTAAQRLRFECEQFFLSDWFYELSGVDGKAILERLEEEWQ